MYANLDSTGIGRKVNEQPLANLSMPNSQITLGEKEEKRMRKDKEHVVSAHFVANWGPGGICTSHLISLLQNLSEGGCLSPL